MREQNPFYTTTAWKNKRTQVLKRDDYLCQECKRYGKHTRATEVHHIKFLEDYPELKLDSSNLISLCHACHNKKHPEKAVKTTSNKNKGSYY